MIDPCQTVISFSEGAATAILIVLSAIGLGSIVQLWAKVRKG